jgi:hypothetical protein
MTVSYTDKNGNIIEEPLLDHNKPIASSLYRIRCERLSSKSQIEIKLPILSHNWATGEAKTPPRWVVVWMSFMAGYRPVHMTVLKCFVAHCDDIPRNISQVPLDIGPGDWRVIH